MAEKVNVDRPNEEYHKGRRTRINLYCKYEQIHLTCSTPEHLKCKSVYVTWPTNARPYPVFITYCLLPTCFNRRRGHLYGKLQEYEESKQSFQTHK